MTLRYAGVRIAGLVIASLMLAGCGLLGDDSSSGQTGGSGQVTDVKVAVLPTMDLVPLHLAIESGIFKQEGLNVTPVTANSGSDCVAKLAAGEVQFAFSSYTPFFVAKAKNAADIKLVADATAAVPGYAVVVTMPNSPITSINQLAGKKIAITARATIAHLLTSAQLKAAGVDPNGIQWVEIAFPQMADRLAAGQIDAAFLVEPFIQQAVKKVGAKTLFDTTSGRMAEIPLTGFGAKAEFIDGNRETVEKFQRALKKATEEARKDRAKVDPLLQKIANIDAETASKTVLTNFVSSLDPAQIQRVVDLMVEFKAIDKRIEVSEMVVRPVT
jgi:NitT/TauT family transport system substrate-binding protein